MPESILEQCAAWCDAQARSDWYGRTAGDMVRAFAANFGDATQTAADPTNDHREDLEWVIKLAERSRLDGDAALTRLRALLAAAPREQAPVRDLEKAAALNAHLSDVAPHPDWRGDFERQARAVGFDVSREEPGCDYCHPDSSSAWLWYYTGRLDQACADAAHRANDDDALRQSIGEALSTRRYDLMNNGKQAFDACDACNIDMLLDDVMPLIDAERKGNPSPITGNHAQTAGEPKVEPPKRAIQFRVDIQADSEDGLARTLGGLAGRVLCQDLSGHSVSGGYDAGYEHWLTVSGRPTHDEYVEQLNAYLAARRDA